MPISPIREIATVEFGRIQEHEQASSFPRINGASLDFAGVDTQYATHALHPYVAAINPPLARALLTHYARPTSHILDPFCGGGGVLVECMLNGNPATGLDVNPLAYHISLAKTSHLPSQSTTKELQKLLSVVKPDASAVSSVPDAVSFWYYNHVLEWLIPLARYINSIEDSVIRAVFQVALSATARDVMLTYRGEVRLRKMREADQARFKPVVVDAFRRRVELAIDRVSRLPLTSNVEVHLNDCRNIKDDESFDLVITSPPYGDDKNGVGYFQFSRNMLYFLGYSLDKIKNARTSFLGLGAKVDIDSWDVPPSLCAYLEHIAKRSTRLYGEALRFYHDYYFALRRLSEVTRERIIVVTGDRVLARTFLDNGRITLEILESLGWMLEHYYSREIRKKRIANLGGDGGQIATEHILVHKPR